MSEPQAVVGENGRLLEVQDLRVRFGDREVVRGLSFGVKRGETLGLVGESGSGKSATSLALMGLLPPSASVTGEVKLYFSSQGGFAYTGPPAHWVRTENGLVDVTRRPPVMEPTRVVGTMMASSCSQLLTLPERELRNRRGRDIAMIFQEPMTALNPSMTVGRQIGEAWLAHHPKTSRNELRERVLAGMREVALPDPERRMGDYPHQFSGGQRQRILIAMALINKPKLLIADEPTTALDVTVQKQILELLRGLREQHGLAMLFISHDLAVVGQVADRVAVMQAGEIVEQAEAREIFARPQHAYTRRLLLASPSMTTRRGVPLPV